jgi:hypothetical protein
MIWTDFFVTTGLEDDAFHDVNVAYVLHWFFFSYMICIFRVVFNFIKW